LMSLSVILPDHAQNARPPKFAYSLTFRGLAFHSRPANQAGKFVLARRLRRMIFFHPCHEMRS
jgi:hypothetical protein